MDSGLHELDSGLHELDSELNELDSGFLVSGTLTPDSN